MDMKPWIDAVSGNASINAVARASGIDQSSLNRQIKAKSVSPENIVKIARAYGESVTGALVVLGLITSEEASGDEVSFLRALARPAEADVLAGATDEALLAEIGNRLERRRWEALTPEERFDETMRQVEEIADSVSEDRAGEITSLKSYPDVTVAPKTVRVEYSSPQKQAARRPRKKPGTDQ